MSVQKHTPGQLQRPQVIWQCPPDSTQASKQLPASRCAGGGGKAAPRGGEGWALGWHTRKAAALWHAHGTSRPTNASQPGSPALGRWDSQALAGPCTCSRPAARPALKLAARRRARQPAVDGPPQPLAAAAALERWWAGQPSLQQGRAGGGMGVLSAPSCRVADRAAPAPSAPRARLP